MCNEIHSKTLILHPKKNHGTNQKKNEAAKMCVQARLCDDQLKLYDFQIHQAFLFGKSEQTIERLSFNSVLRGIRGARIQGHMHPACRIQYAALDQGHV